MKTNVKVLLNGFVVFSSLAIACQPAAKTTETNQTERREKTAFQTGQPWKPTTDVRADVAIVYGVGATLRRNVRD